MITTTRSPGPSLIALAIAVVIAVAACSGGAGQSASPSPSPSASPSPSPSPSPSEPASEPIGGGGSNPGPVDPGAGQAKLVVPKPGQLDLRPVGPTSIEAAVDGRRVTVKVTWWSGVEPCYVLDSVTTERDGNDITITLFEGASEPDVACIEIALEKATIVDLGELEPGTWTISAPGGEAVPVTVTIS